VSRAESSEDPDVDWRMILQCR